ncbi:hypothetical protein E2C01_044878 [Portunus trituberculatus]|uniref:Uncharacterized protein n=1 Tax=Portunus trituberculatus TaxID=210409 RepID=A0A5B7FU83_PORTR|nr:hypothetical protein [Portunus trituberculatus]
MNHDIKEGEFAFFFQFLVCLGLSVFLSICLSGCLSTCSRRPFYEARLALIKVRPQHLHYSNKSLALRAYLEIQYYVNGTWD